MKFIILALMIIFSIIIQSSILPYFSIMGATANLLLAVVLSVSLLKRKPYGGIMGLIIGFIVDALFSPVIGVNALILFLIGYIFESIEFHLNKDDLHTPIILMMVSTVGYNFLYFLMMYFAAYEISLIHFVKYKLLIELIYNCILIIPVYKIISNIFIAPAIRFYRD